MASLDNRSSIYGSQYLVDEVEGCEQPELSSDEIVAELKAPVDYERENEEDRY